MVRANVTAVSPSTAADTEYCPAVLLAVKAGAVATPLLPVATEALLLPPANVPLAPLEGAGAVKTTVVPGTEFPKLSLTFADSVVVNADPSFAVCPDPALRVIVAAAAGVTVMVCEARSADASVSVAVIDCDPLLRRATLKT